MRLPNSAHTSRPWRIHEVAPDFRLEDVWAPPISGGPDDFRRLIDLVASFDPTHAGPWPVRALFAARWKLGGLLGWDASERGVGTRVATLADRLPADLRAGRPGPQFAATPFRSLYLLDDEWAAEVANETVHGVLHIGWVPDDSGRCHAQLAVLVKPNGVLGEAYLAAIKPFRYLVVYPLMLRELGRRWQARAAASSAHPAGAG